MCMDKDMDINQAAKKAFQQDCYIQRKSKKDSDIVFYPTNSPSHIEIWSMKKEKMIMPNWNPKLDDLVATDWQLIKKESDPIKRTLSKIIN